MADHQGSPPPHVHRDVFDFREPLRRLAKIVRWHWLLVAIVIAATLGLVIAYIQLRPPIYEAQTILLVEPKEDMVRDRFYDQWNIFRKDEAESEAQLVTGGPVLAEVVQDLDLKWDDVFHPLSSQVRRWWQYSAIGIKYREIKHRFFPPEPNPWQLTEAEREQIDTLLDLKKGVTLEAVEGTHVGRLIVRGPTPRVAEIANAIAKTYIRQRVERHEDEARRAYDALTPMLEAAQTRMMSLQEEMVAFRESNDVYFDFEREQAIVKQLATVEGTLIERETSRARAMREIEVVESLIAGEDPELTSVRVEELNTIRQQMIGQLLAQDLELAARLQRFLPGAPEVTEVEELIAILQRNIDDAKEMIPSSESKALNSIYVALREKRGAMQIHLAGDEEEIARLKDLQQSLSAQLSGLSGKQRAIQEYFRVIGEARAEYEALLEKHTQAMVTMKTIAQALPSMRLMEEAKPPQDPSWPNTKVMVAAALVIGAMLGVLAAYARETLSGRVRDYHMRSLSAGHRYTGTVRVRTSALHAIRNLATARRT